MTQPTYTIMKNSSDSPLDQFPAITVNHYLWETNGYQPEVRIGLAYREDELQISMVTYESNPLIRYTQLNDPVFKDSCVEFFLQPAPETDNRYLNFEINAAGTLLLGLGDGRMNRLYLSEVDPALFHIRASINQNDSTDGRQFWEIQFVIPFDWLTSLFPSFCPKEGALMRGNFYKCGDDTPAPHYGCWSKVTSDKPDYHRSIDFGQLLLG